MDGVGADSQFAQAAVGFVGVQDVRRLGRAVGFELVVVPPLPAGIVEVDVTQDVASGGQVDDAGIPGGGELRYQQPGKFEVLEMICADLQFEAVLGPAEGGEHDAGVVHQDMDRRRDVADRCRRRAHTVQRREVELNRRDPGAAHLGRDPPGRLRQGLLVAGGQDDVSARGGERPGRLAAQPGRRAGDHTDPAGQVDSLDDLQGAALEGMGPRHQRPFAKARSDSTCVGSSEGRTFLRAAARSAAVTSVASMDWRIAVRAASRSSATQSAAL